MEDLFDLLDFIDLLTGEAPPDRFLLPYSDTFPNTESKLWDTKEPRP